MARHYTTTWKLARATLIAKNEAGTQVSVACDAKKNPWFLASKRKLDLSAEENE
jgi:hypothetical protein